VVESIESNKVIKANISDPMDTKLSVARSCQSVDLCYKTGTADTSLFVAMTKSIINGKASGQVWFRRLICSTKKERKKAIERERETQIRLNAN